MAFTEALRLVIDADTRGAIQGVEKLGATADRELSKSQSRLDKWGSGLTKVGTGMIAFGAAAVAGLGALAMESEQANLAQVKLQNTIDNMPKLAGASAKEFTDLADSIQDVTAADADAIVEAEALLGTFQLTADEIKGITPLVVDYARKFGVDMADAAVQVGKALDGQVGALKRNGVSIDETLFKTDRYRAVQEALSDQVGGFAEAEGKTFAGSLERMKNQLGDLAEGVGGGAVDAFTTMFGAVDKLAGAFEKISPGAQNTIGKIATFGAVGLIAAGGISTLIGKAIEVRHNFSQAAEGVSNLTTKLGGMKAVAGIAAGAAGLAGVLVAIKAVSDAAAEANLEDFIDMLNSSSTAADKSVQKFIRLADQWGDLEEGFSTLLDKSPEAAAAYIEQAEAAGIAADKVEKLRSMLDAKKDTDAGASVAQKEYTDDVQAGADAMDDSAESTRDATTALQDYANALAAQFDPLFGFISAQQNLQQSQADLAEATDKLTEARATGDPTKIAEAERDYDEAVRGSSEAVINLQQKMLTLNEAVQNGDVNLEDAQQQMYDAAIQMGYTGEQAEAMAGQIGGAAGEAERLRQSSNINILLATTGTSAVMADVANVKRQLDTIPRTVQTEIITTFHSVFGGPPNPRGRQHGGPVRAGEAYVVGEKHAELFIPNENGTVLPDVPQFVPPRTGVALHGAGGSAGGGINVMVNVTAPFGSPAEIGKRVADAIRPLVRVQHGGNVQAALGFSR